MRMQSQFASRLKNSNLNTLKVVHVVERVCKLIHPLWPFIEPIAVPIHFHMPSPLRQARYMFE